MYSPLFDQSVVCGPRVGVAGAGYERANTVTVKKDMPTFFLLCTSFRLVLCGPSADHDACEIYFSI